jgi:5-methylcytosine-specific restriction endonuclease McrA
MSEASVARAQKRSVGHDFVVHQCGHCLAKFGTMTALMLHEQCDHPKVRATQKSIKYPADPTITHPAISGDLTRLAAQRGNRCGWCGDEFGEGHLSPTREHLVPKSKGGKNTADNILIVHSRCNHIRGTIPAKAFRRLMNGEALTAEDIWPGQFRIVAGMVELVDTLDLKSDASVRAGSSPAPGTNPLIHAV